MFDEMLRSVRAQLYERAVSPLMGSIIISWGIWNYKFILLILSGVAITEKYRIIDEVLFYTWQQVYLRGALYPVITALVYLFAYPYPAKFVFEFSRSRQKEISDIKRKIEDETLLTAKQSRAMRREMYALDEEHQNDLLRKDSEIERLKREIDEVIGDIPADTEESVDLPADKHISKDLFELLERVGKYDGEVSEKILVKESPEGHVEAKYNLGELENNDYLKRSYSNDMSDYAYELTHKGRSYLVKGRS